MNIQKMYILPQDSDVARVYEWNENYLTFEELISFIASRGKIPDMTKFIEKNTEDSSYDAI